MSKQDALMLILGMSLVTYLPRMLPLYLPQRGKLSAFTRRFLRNIPYAALGALIIPGLLGALPGHPFVLSAGTFSAVLLSWRFGGFIWPVVGAVACTSLLLML